MIKKIVHNDAYRPHTFEEISALLAPEVAATLDPNKEYGVQWYNRQRVTERTVSEPDTASPILDVRGILSDSLGTPHENDDAAGDFLPAERHLSLG
jgi:hypothetical protein